MMKSSLVDYVGEKAIVRVEKSGRVEWLVCDWYDDTKPEGCKWFRGQYYSNLGDAVASALPYKVFLDIHIHGLHDGKFMSSHYVVDSKKNALIYLTHLLPAYFESEVIDKVMKKLKSEDSAFFEGNGDSINIDINPYELGDELKY